MPTAGLNLLCHEFVRFMNLFLKFCQPIGTVQI